MEKQWHGQHLWALARRWHSTHRDTHPLCYACRDISTDMPHANCKSQWHWACRHGYSWWKPKLGDSVEPMGRKRERASYQIMHRFQHPQTSPSWWHLNWGIPYYGGFLPRQSGDTDVVRKTVNEWIMRRLRPSCYCICQCHVCITD